MSLDLENCHLSPRPLLSTKVRWYFISATSTLLSARFWWPDLLDAERAAAAFLLRRAFKKVANLADD